MTQKTLLLVDIQVGKQTSITKNTEKRGLHIITSRKEGPLMTYNWGIGIHVKSSKTMEDYCPMRNYFFVGVSEDTPQSNINQLFMENFSRHVQAKIPSKSPDACVQHLLTASSAAAEDVQKKLGCGFFIVDEATTKSDVDGMVQTIYLSWAPGQSYHTNPMPQVQYAAYLQVVYERPVDPAEKTRINRTAKMLYRKKVDELLQYGIESGNDGMRESTERIAVMLAKAIENSVQNCHVTPFVADIEINTIVLTK